MIHKRIAILKYNIIIPVKNEENFLRENLYSVVNQTLLAEQIIIVNDGSTDATAQIAEEFVQKYPFIKLISLPTENQQHEPGEKIVNVFYKGFEQLQNDWDFIVKLDADTVLPKNYFEEVAQVFRSNPKAGISGGLAYIEKNGKWVLEKIGNKKQVRGPFKSYSKACFEKIGGLKKSIGWDTADELLALFHGFEIQVIPHLKVKLLKPTGSVYKAIHGKKTGQAFYRLDYGFIISFIAAVKAGKNQKSIKLIFTILQSYCSSFLKSDEKIVSPEEGKFIRKFRWKGILKKLSIKN
ncbi:MAG: glycosyltransferase family 2 protein [Weeksellaceae bacterium]|nr:glycosyltransferase family 2 protein [Weeksellaceae bacterium]